SKVTPLSPVLNKPPVESPTKNTAGFRGSIAISDTRPPIAAGPIDRALKFLKRMSVILGGVASGAGEKGADDIVGLGEGDAAASGVGDVEGRVPASVADGCWAFQPFGSSFKSIVVVIFSSQVTRNTRNLSRIMTGWVCTRISSAARERCSLQ